MRTLANSTSINGCKKEVERLKKRGWQQVSDVKLDDSMISYGYVRYVAVMERAENLPKLKGWGRL